MKFVVHPALAAASRRADKVALLAERSRAGKPAHRLHYFAIRSGSVFQFSG